MSAVIPQLPLGSSPRTLVAWLKPEGSQYVNWGVIHQGNQDCSGHMFGLSLQTVGNLGFWGGCQDWTSTLRSANNQWCFVALTYDGAVVRLCVNGSWQTNAIGTLNTLASRLWMGAETVSDGSSFRSYYRGVIDDVRFYNRELAAAEVESLYALNSLPQVRFVQAFTVDCANLTVGSNYQLQVSSDLNAWTNWGAPFTATNATFLNPGYERMEDCGKLFFRLQVQ